jgi:DNA repair exonuclease SbcCD ATPase subunit
VGNPARWRNQGGNMKLEFTEEDIKDFKNAPGGPRAPVTHFMFDNLVSENKKLNERIAYLEKAYRELHRDTTAMMGEDARRITELEAQREELMKYYENQNSENMNEIEALEAEIEDRHEAEQVALKELAQADDKIMKLEEERDRLKLENDVLESMSRHAPSPCGHSSQYAYTDDGGKHIVCLLCSRARHAALVEAGKKTLAALISWHITHGVPETTKRLKIVENMQAALAEVKG